VQRSWAAPAFGNVTRGLRQLALAAVREGSGQLVLREIEDRDLGVLFEHSRDRDAIRMAAFTSPEAGDRTSFERRWARLRSDSSTTNRVVELDGRVVGHIASFDLEGHREVTYWIGREDWGRGIATRALQEFLQLEATRPLYAHAASDNAASIRVLTKCGFLIVGEGRGFAHGRNEETDEVVLRLDASRLAATRTNPHGDAEIRMDGTPPHVGGEGSTV
jgi:RimJ/RimL family protein N-acetyltransferase